MASFATMSLAPDVYVEDSLPPICIAMGVDGVAEITPSWLGIRFGYNASSLWLENKVLDPVTRKVQYSVVAEPITLENNATMWKLQPGQYHLFGLTESVINASTVLLTPRSSSTISTVVSLFPRVKSAPGLEVRIDISNSSDDEKKSSVQSRRPSSMLLPPSSHSENTLKSTPSSLPSPQTPKPKHILPSLQRLGSMSRNKTILKKSISIPFVLSKFPSYLHLSMVMSSMFSFPFFHLPLSRSPNPWRRWINGTTDMCGSRQ